MSRRVPLTKEYIDWYMTEVRRRQQIEETAKRLATDFLVFVSYSWADADIARDVTEALERRGIRYVQDRKSISWGDRISEWADSEINQSTHYLLILTKTSAQSRWCAYEYGIAVGRTKGMLTFIADSELDVPPFAAGHAAVRQLRDIESFFAKARIDEVEVEQFLEELLQVKVEELEAYVPRVGEGAIWDAPVPEQLGEHRSAELPLSSIELDIEGQSLTLEAGTPPARTERYEFAYSLDLTAVLVTPAKEGSEILGVLDESDHDRPRPRPGPPSVQDKPDPSKEMLHGWPASADFWAHALLRLQTVLLGNKGSD